MNVCSPVWNLKSHRIAPTWRTTIQLAVSLRDFGFVTKRFNDISKMYLQTANAIYRKTGWTSPLESKHCKCETFRSFSSHCSWNTGCFAGASLAEVADRPSVEVLKLLLSQTRTCSWEGWLEFVKPLTSKTSQCQPLYDSCGEQVER